MTALERPNYFVDEMLRGAFASMCHRHEFAADGEGTLYGWWLWLPLSILWVC